MNPDIFIWLLDLCSKETGTKSSDFHEFCFVVFVSVWIKRLARSLRLTRQPPLRGGRRSPTRFSIRNFVSTVLSEYYLFYLILFEDYLIWRKPFSRDFYPDGSAQPGIPTSVQKGRSNLGSRRRPLVQACHCATSSHTEFDLFIFPRAPGGTTINSRPHSRAMLDCVSRKNAKNPFFK